MSILGDRIKSATEELVNSLAGVDDATAELQSLQRLFQEAKVPVSVEAGDSAGPTLSWHVKQQLLYIDDTALDSSPAEQRIRTVLLNRSQQLVNALERRAMRARDARLTRAKLVKK